MKELLEPHISTLIAGIVTGFVGWFFGRKKASAELESNQIENAKKLLEYYKELADDLGSRLDKAIDNLQKSETEKQEVIRQLQDTKLQMLKFEKTVEELTEELKKFKQLNGKTA